MADGSPSAEQLLAELRQTLRSDAATGSVRPLAHYLKQFPGHDQDVASEYLTSASPRGGGNPAGTARGSGASGLIGAYRIVKELGRGGQGIVYLAEDTRLSRRVALKVLPELAQASGDVLLRFHREAEAASRIDHPGIATVYETGTSDGIPYIAMRYVEGETLAARIGAAQSVSAVDVPGNVSITVAGDGADAVASAATPSTAPPHARQLLRVQTSRILELFVKLAETLHAAHESGIIHRDIKPQNLLLGRDGRPVILDFGLARDVNHSESKGMTRAGDFFGTPIYMSPEQLLASRVRLDRRTDVWSLGVCLYECLTLHRPFQHPTREGLYVAIQTKEPTDPRRFNPALPPDLVVVLATALEKDRDRRYHTARDFADELARVLHHEPIHARAAGPLLRLRRFSQRQPVVAASLVGAFLSLGGGLAASLFLLQRAGIAEATIKADRDKVSELLVSLGGEDEAEVAALARDAALLWPATPDRVDAYRHWLERAAKLEGSLAIHRATLERLERERGDGAKAPDAATAGDFDAARRQWQHDTVAALVAKLETFFAQEPTENSRTEVKARLEFAQSVEARSLAGAGIRARWEEAIDSIADRQRCPRYQGLRIEPQLGLIPIGQDLESGLWEFVHLATSGSVDHPVPERDPASGRLSVTEEMGLVFVLLPGAVLELGARPPDASHPIGSPNVDPGANDLQEDRRPSDAPLHEATIAPFFMSKYEMTQGQWRRVFGEVPSSIVPGIAIGGSITDLRHPVENVSWRECTATLQKLGLLLPTESQWEYACRGGTTSIVWTGDTPESLREPSIAANLSEQSRMPFVHFESTGSAVWTDGHHLHAPVGSFRPNPFGLFDVLGNVCEWCRGEDGEGPDGQWLEGAHTVERSGRSRTVASVRGGSFLLSVTNSRSAARIRTVVDWSFIDLGLRPIRELDR